MAETTTISGHETIELMENRLRLLVGARLKPRGRIKNASLKIDELREKYGNTEQGYDGVEVIRKWRESR